RFAAPSGPLPREAPAPRIAERTAGCRPISDAGRGLPRGAPAWVVCPAPPVALPPPPHGPQTMHAFSIALLNQKGGVGKTSTCHHLAGTFSKAGKKVLLIDADPQASLTQGFWGPDAMRALPRGATVAALFDDGIPPEAGELIRST